MKAWLVRKYDLLLLITHRSQMLIRRERSGREPGAGGAETYRPFQHEVKPNDVITGGLAVEEGSVTPGGHFPARLCGVAISIRDEQSWIDARSTIIPTTSQ